MVGPAHLAGRGHRVKGRCRASPDGLHCNCASAQFIAGMPINLLNLQAICFETNSTSKQNRLVWQAMAATLSPPRILPSGDSAITVEFSRNIDDAANQRVLALDRTLASEPVAGVTETVPTYRSLLVHYDPGAIDFDTLGEQLVALAQRPVPPATRTRRWRIPVVYGGEHGIDLEDVAKTLRTTPDDIVARHVAGDHLVAMIRFNPGSSYLRRLDKL